VTDKCLLHRRDKDWHGVSITALQVDDNFGVGTSEFMGLEEEKSRNLRCKHRMVMKIGDIVHFNGAEISLLNRNIFLMRQSKKLMSLKCVETQNDLLFVRTAMQYIATTCRPDLAAACQLLASRISMHADSNSCKILNRLVKTALKLQLNDCTSFQLM
jgi:hypothetical protein